MAEENGINFTFLKKIIKNQCEKLPDIVDEVINQFPNNIGKDILAVVEKNSKRLLRGV